MRPRLGLEASGAHVSFVARWRDCDDQRARAALAERAWTWIADFLLRPQPGGAPSDALAESPLVRTRDHVDPYIGRDLGRALAASPNCRLRRIDRVGGRRLSARTYRPTVAHVRRGRTVLLRLNT